MESSLVSGYTHEIPELSFFHIQALEIIAPIDFVNNIIFSFYKAEVCNNKILSLF